MMVMKRKVGKVAESESDPRPYCLCWSQKEPVEWQELNGCSCGEEIDMMEWRWQSSTLNLISQVVISEDQKQVTFHPFYSSGTAAVRGDAPMQINCHYYWEVKMLSETYGTDIMVGVGTNKVNVPESQYRFTSLLGQDMESYGLSYKGSVRHNGTEMKESSGFCRGSIIGVRLDMWEGTLEFYINRQPQGIAFYNLRRHGSLYPMLCSTAAQSSLRLIYASSWRASLLVDAAKILATTVRNDSKLRLPPGLWHTLKSHFWLTLPTEGCVSEENENEPAVKQKMKKVPTVPLTPGMRRRHWLILPKPTFMMHQTVS
ncbi:SPRY domain-containing SOCS box protein 3-like isoform X2 [Battus philenor]|uniref:SPRY domain-containing SOCS box protein 3-like isoform X2 n=1 Tax=Battus philenor TaxID=42288 RepID=UPI0035CF4F1A